MGLCRTPTYNDRMLRITVIALVVANLILLAFGISKPGASDPAKAAAPAEPAAATDPGIPGIRLYSELGDDPAAMSGGRRCYTLGPFHSRAELDAARARIEPLAVGVGERRTEAMVDRGYWVFLPPYATLAEASKTLHFLKLLGFTDVGVIYDGEHARSISLGYFLRRKNALKRKQSFEAKGYRPQVRTQRQVEPRFWLDFELSLGAELPALDANNLPVDFEQRAVPCSGSKAPAATVAEPLLENVEPPAAGDGASGQPDVVDPGTQAAAEDDGADPGGSAGKNGPEPDAGAPADDASGKVQSHPATAPGDAEGADEGAAAETGSAAENDAGLADPERPKMTKGPPH